MEFWGGSVLRFEESDIGKKVKFNIDYSQTGNVYGIGEHISCKSGSVGEIVEIATNDVCALVKIEGKKRLIKLWACVVIKGRIDVFESFNAGDKVKVDIDKSFLDKAVYKALKDKVFNIVNTTKDFILDDPVSYVLDTGIEITNFKSKYLIKVS